MRHIHRDCLEDNFQSVKNHSRLAALRARPLRLHSRPFAAARELRGCSCRILYCRSPLCGGSRHLLILAQTADTLAAAADIAADMQAVGTAADSPAADSPAAGIPAADSPAAVENCYYKCVADSFPGSRWVGVLADMQYRRLAKTKNTACAADKVFQPAAVPDSRAQHTQAFCSCQLPAFLQPRLALPSGLNAPAAVVKHAMAFALRAALHRLLPALFLLLFAALQALRFHLQARSYSQEASQ
ncbi:MAG: hypothetical protein BWY62_01363 [Firmicutes bacterium ADurb.Bin356]|nr:MAG: hypothetical protein BWY62_01363 [Firmicutes bacterium ADurb.Bin356]